MKRPIAAAFPASMLLTNITSFYNARTFEIINTNLQHFHPGILMWLGRHRLQQNQHMFSSSNTNLNVNVTVDTLLDPQNISEDSKNQLRFLRDAIYGDEQHELPDIRDVDAEVTAAEPVSNDHDPIPFPAP